MDPEANEVMLASRTKHIQMKRNQTRIHLVNFLYLDKDFTFIIDDLESIN